MTRRLTVLMLGCVLAACGGPGAQQLGSYQPAKIQTADDAKKWASMSAPNMYFAGLAPYVVIAAAGSMDAGCPSKTDDGITLRYSGGCTTPRGAVWSGSATVERARGADGKAADGGFGNYRYDGLSVKQTTTCDGGTGEMTVAFDGTYSLSGTDSDGTFKVDVRETSSGIASGACATAASSSAWAYSGSFKKTNSDTTWNGSGRAGSSTLGVADVSTKDELVSTAVCLHEAASGTTTVSAGSTSMVITYDGATKCDSDSRVKWSLNGADQGELVGVQCGVAPGGELAGLALALASAALWSRRRSRR